MSLMIFLLIYITIEMYLLVYQTTLYLHCLHRCHYLSGQLRHVMDERKLLACMNSRFVLKLYGTLSYVTLLICMITIKQISIWILIKSVNLPPLIYFYFILFYRVLLIMLAIHPFQLSFFFLQFLYPYFSPLL